MHGREFVKNPAELFVGLDGDVTVLAEYFELQEAAIPALGKLEVFEQAGLFLADGEFVCKGIDRGIDVRVAKSSSCSLISETVLPRVAAGRVENWFRMPCKKLRSQFLEDVPVPAFQRPALPLPVLAMA